MNICLICKKRVGVHICQVNGKEEYCCDDSFCLEDFTELVENAKKKSRVQKLYKQYLKVRDQEEKEEWEEINKLK